MISEKQKEYREISYIEGRNKQKEENIVASCAKNVISQTST